MIAMVSPPPETYANWFWCCSDTSLIYDDFLFFPLETIRQTIQWRGVMACPWNKCYGNHDIMLRWTIIYRKSQIIEWITSSIQNNFYFIKTEKNAKDLSSPPFPSNPIFSSSLSLPYAPCQNTVAHTNSNKAIEGSAFFFFSWKLLDHCSHTFFQTL